MSVGHWEPTWLGTRSRRLYAALHPAAGTPLAGVLLVPPLLDDLPRSRRFITEVASELAQFGLPSMRFDFFGTGDSGGNGDEVDFASMQVDLDLAIAAMRALTGTRRVVLMAWRGAALPLHEWLARGGAADLVVLWEPIVDGGSWLQELVDCDARQRLIRPPPRPGVPWSSDPADGQLMGFLASARLRINLAQARLERDAAVDATRAWAVLHADSVALPVEIERVFALPASAPRFSGGASMDATFFLTPTARDVVEEIALAMRERAWA